MSGGVQKRWLSVKSRIIRSYFEKMPRFRKKSKKVKKNKLLQYDKKIYLPGEDHTLHDCRVIVCQCAGMQFGGGFGFRPLFHESPPENAAPALNGSQLRRRLKLSQELCQIGQFFSDLLRLRMAAVEEQCCAPGLLGRSDNTDQ